MKSQGKNYRVVTLGEKGEVTVPLEMRKKFRLKKNSKLAVMAVEGVIILYPINEEIDKICNKIANAFKEKGVTLKEALKGLEKARREIYRERCGNM
jgi:AbrB family looped-hinge helix DNA binding protein